MREYYEDKLRRARDFLAGLRRLRERTEENVKLQVEYINSIKAEQSRQVKGGAGVPPKPPS